MSIRLVKSLILILTLITILSLFQNMSVKVQGEECIIITVLIADGSPVYGALVVILGQGLEGYTDPDGKVSFGCLEPNTLYTLWVIDSIHGFETYQDFTTNSTGGADVTIILNDACVTVYVQYSSGDPVSGAYVSIEDILTGFTGDDGAVSWCGEENLLDPNTSYYASANYDSLSGSKFFTTDSTGGADVTVVLNGASVTVYVEPIDIYIIWIEDAWGNIVAGPSSSDGSGDFTACLEDGTYIAYAEPPVGGAKVEGFTVPDTTSVTIIFCYEITVHVQDSNGDPVITKVSIYKTTGEIVVEGQWTDDNGDYKICLEDGDYYTFAVHPATGEYSEKCYFTVPDTTYVVVEFDVMPPTVSILNPKQNKTHVGSIVSLTFTVDEQTSWMGYSLDGEPTITIEGNTTLTGLSDGGHTVTVYARDIVGNEGSDTVDFTTDSSLAITGGETPLFEHI